MARHPDSTLIAPVQFGDWDRTLRNASDDQIALFLQRPWSVWRRSALEAVAAERQITS